MKTLFRAAGKFVYPRGSDILTHFLPLQDFCIELALNYSLLTALSVNRRFKHDGLLKNYEVAQWRHRLLTEEVVAMIIAGNFASPRFHDFGNNFALLFEELRSAHDCANDAEYLIHNCGNEHIEHLSALHITRDSRVTLSSLPMSNSMLDKRSVILLNYVLGQRLGHSEPPKPHCINLNEAQGCVCAWRVGLGDRQNVRTTVYGTDVVIPSLSHIKSWMTSTRLPWHWRLLKNHDCGFFLPEADKSDVGIVLAYCAQQAAALPGFEKL